MDLIKDLESAPLYLIPIITLGVGLVGSLHCASMCGPLIAASSYDFKSNSIYQIARLFGYLLMCFVLYFFGKKLILDNMISLSSAAEWIIAITFMLIGFKFIFDFKIKTPSFLEKLNQRVFKFSITQKNLHFKSALVGFFSVLLPCGYLYTFLFSLIALQSLSLSTLAIFFFWLGTLPALLFGVHLIQNKVIHKYLPKRKFTGMAFILIGLITLYDQFEYKYYFKDALF